MNYSMTVSLVTKRICLSTVSILLALLIGLLAVSQPARADTYVVTNTNSSGPGSLRQAISDANSNPGADTITFDAATNGIPIVLSGAVGEDANASGDLDILDGSDLTIQGNGAANTIIDGGGNDRVFHICPDGGCANTITIDGVAIRSGSAASAPSVQGGGICNKDATLILQNSRVGENLALVGGGIYNIGGVVTVDNTHIAANVANTGGGIHNQGALNVQNGSVIGGAGTGNRATDGGGISNLDGTTTVDSSDVISNTATEEGGGIWNNGTLDIQNGSGIGEAGAGNQANDGGGIYNYTDGVVTVGSSAVISNTSIEYGGGITNWGTLTIDDSSVRANIAEYGGGIYNYGTLHVQNGSLIGGADAGNQASSGGGIYNGGTATVDDSTVSANISNNGGGGIYNYGTLNVQNGSLIGVSGAGNQAGTTGGGIFNYDGVVRVNNSSVSANRAEDDGGGITNYLYLFVQNGSTISANRASNNGGGIYSAYTATITDTRILNNTAGGNGGGVYSSNNIADKTHMTGSCIVGNSAMSFFNDEPEQQIATGNWWGAAGGPNTPGADTYGGNVDVSGYLTAPILGCAPELQVGKVNDTGGSGVVDTPFYWTLTISNTGMISATFDALQTILVDDLPAIGPTYGTPIAGNVVDVEGSANIQCSIAGNTLTCTAASGAVILAPLTGSFEVTFSVTPDAPMTLVNPAGDCQVDPDGNVTEKDETNNGCPANVVDVALTNYLYLPMVLR